MPEIDVSTHSADEMVDVTRHVKALIPKDMTDGACLVYCPHTTAAVTINENTDPDVCHDILEKLNRLVPRDEEFYRHAEGNSAAHVRASMVGFSVLIPVREGELALGIWQAIYLCEFDGPRPRHLIVEFMRD